jgi:hypothetical protein
MSDDITPTPEADPVADLLGPPAGPESSLRGPLRRRTVRLLRRRILLRRAVIAAALAAAFLLGLLVPRPTSPSQPSPPEPAPQTTAPAPQPAPPAVEKRQDPPSAVVLEWRAFDELNAELYRQAGQCYLREDNDPLSAVRCYRQSLNAGGPNALTVSDDDDFLLIALKDARQREKRDAKRN